MNPEPSTLLSVSDAIRLIDSLPVQPRSISTFLQDRGGYRLAEDLRADQDFPAFDKCLMDGYAARSADITTIPAELLVIGESAAGQTGETSIGLNQAIAVMTGAPIPRGADCVVPIEQTDSLEFVNPGDTVRILKAISAGQNIAPRGSDCAGGTIVLTKGTRINAARTAVLAAIGAITYAQWYSPRCGILATGNEIISVRDTPQPGQVRNTNNPMLLALLRRLIACKRVDWGFVRDDRWQISERIQEALRESDVLFVTGGMSMGKYDFVPQILVELGGELKITKLAIRPGKPFVLAAMPDGKYVFGLPGNPVSAYVCTLRLASRLLTRMAGGEPEDRIMNLPLAEPLPANGPREFYQPARIENQRIYPLKWKGSADIFTLAQADGLIIRPPSAPAAAAGESVPVLPTL